MKQLTGKRRLWYAISIIAMIPGIISLVVFGLRLGIDFTGGTLWELQFDRPVQTEQVTRLLADEGFGNTIVQLSGEGNAENPIVLIRMREMTEGSPEKQEVSARLTEEIGPFTELRIETVGAAVGTEIRNRAILAVALASIGVLLYIAYAFRNTQKPILYGLCAIAAMLHDVIIIIGIFSILGWVANVEIDALFVTALLTIIGFSVHDTIVVFDRIRENLAHARPTTPFEEIVNHSIAQTLVRSLNTSITALFALLALYLFGGVTTRYFVLALLLGIALGTYSSIFNASQLLVSWEKGEIQRLFGRFRGRSTEPTPTPTR